MSCFPNPAGTRAILRCPLNHFFNPSGKRNSTLDVEVVLHDTCVKSGSSDDYRKRTLRHKVFLSFRSVSKKCCLYRSQVPWRCFVPEPSLQKGWKGSRWTGQVKSPNCSFKHRLERYHVFLDSGSLAKTEHRPRGESARFGVLMVISGLDRSDERGWRDGGE